MFGKGAGRVGNQRTNQYHPNYNISKNSPEDLKRPTVFQTPVRDHQLTLMSKTHNNIYNNDECSEKKEEENSLALTNR